ncbi:hypothetical protein DFJ73DRAFT_838824 [Zopfochytrium polystomum]|nr:hypothetical protein DFJ73DRAFT_838824 [Zopfochytrium polystomum]
MHHIKPHSLPLHMPLEPPRAPINPQPFRKVEHGAGVPRDGRGCARAGGGGGLAGVDGWPTEIEGDGEGEVAGGDRAGETQVEPADDADLEFVEPDVVEAAFGFVLELFVPERGRRLRLRVCKGGRDDHGVGLERLAAPVELECERFAVVFEVVRGDLQAEGGLGCELGLDVVEDVRGGGEGDGWKVAEDEG